VWQSKKKYRLPRQDWGQRSVEHYSSFRRAVSDVIRVPCQGSALYHWDTRPSNVCCSLPACQGIYLSFACLWVALTLKRVGIR
jgi:hypothetical protein